MDEINCPLCGKPNPVENKYCEYCLGYLDNEKSQPADPVDAGNAENEESKGGFDSAAEKPEWLTSFEEPSKTGSDIPEDKGLGLELPAADTAGWMPGSLQETSSTADESQPVSPFLSDSEEAESGEIPAWLNDALDEESSPESYDNEEPVEITPFQEDPDDQESKPDTARSLESAGPLAGLSGLLSAEPGVTRIRRPGEYSAKVRLSESQQQHVELLQNLLEDEDQVKPLPGKSPISQQHVLRWVIALVLLLAISWSLLFSSDRAPLPIYDEGSAELNRLINQLPENAKVLVGFDYEPGLADELDSAAVPVFNHLMERSALFTLISTSPNGPILAERFLSSGILETSYRNGLEYINLGYIPGGAAGLISFIENPSGTTPFSIDGHAVWETETGESLPPVAGINEIGDFEMIILLVDDPDLARIWIEQLSPIVTDPNSLISLVLITSAQLEPVVRPYYESLPQPVNGLVVGLRGGATYARLIGGDQLPGKFWDAFGMGTLIAALLILVGGLGYYVVPELSRTVQGEEKVD